MRELAPQARLSGRSTLRFFGLDIYEARLWADAGFALELEYHRALSRQRDFPEAQASDWQQRGGGAGHAAGLGPRRV